MLAEFITLRPQLDRFQRQTFQDLEIVSISKTCFNSYYTMFMKHHEALIETLSYTVILYMLYYIYTHRFILSSYYICCCFFGCFVDVEFCTAAWR